MGSQSPAGAPALGTGHCPALPFQRLHLYLPWIFGSWTPGGASWPVNGTRPRGLHSLRASACSRRAPREPKACALTCLQREGDVHPPVRPHHRATPGLQRCHDGPLGWLLLDAVTDVLRQRAGTGTGAGTGSGPMPVPASTRAQSCRDGGGHAAHPAWEGLFSADPKLGEQGNTPCESSSK